MSVLDHRLELELLGRLPIQTCPVQAPGVTPWIRVSWVLS